MVRQLWYCVGWMFNPKLWGVATCVLKVAHVLRQAVGLYTKEEMRLISRKVSRG